MQYKSGTETETYIREGLMSHMSENVAENEVKENDIAHDSDSESDGNSTDDEKRLKKMRGKQLLSTGLATVAIIHAAHSIYEARERRNARRRLIENLDISGGINGEDLRKMESEFLEQDRDLDVEISYNMKKAKSKWEELNELSQELREWKDRMQERRGRRVAHRSSTS